MPTKLVVNVSAGTEEYVELTAEEIAEREAASAAAAIEREAEEAVAAQTAADKASGQAKLADLGLSADEIAALVG
tara:strand:+ start:1629 stop:1853 length:225 start_codon:yes stop_codon:yes gene_type:complete